MKVNFDKTTTPCVIDDVILWHLGHGFVWDVVEVPTGRRLAVFFCTLLCGDGAIIHFTMAPGMQVTGSTILYSIRKAVRMMKEYGVVYATVPEKKRGLINVLKRIGFVVSANAGYLRDGEKICLLKYFDH